jgi:hypothetical protein
LGKPSFWTIKPTLNDLIKGFFVFAPNCEKLLEVMLLAFLVSLYSRTKREGRPDVLLRQRASLYFLLGPFLILPLIMFAVSRVTTSIFVDRYLLPLAIGDALLLCELTSRLWGMLDVPRNVRNGVIGVLLLALPVLYVRDLRVVDPLPPRDYTKALLQKIPGADPLVITDYGVFIEMVYYRNQARRILTPTDWSVELDPAFGPGGVSGLHEMENWKMYGVYADQILPTGSILESQRNFVVVSDQMHLLWVSRYILSNPKYVTRELQPFMGVYQPLRIWQVQTR